MKTRLWALAIVMALAAAACGSDGAGTVDTASDDTIVGATDESSTTDSPDTTEVDPPATTDGDEGFSGSGSGDFCATAREFDENDPFDNVGLTMGQNSSRKLKGSSTR